VVTQTLVYTLSDDIITLGQLHNQLGHTVRRIEELETQPLNESVTRELEHLNQDRLKFLEEIRSQQAHVDGYNVTT
jgi:hypothetical protein